MWQRSRRLSRLRFRQKLSLATLIVLVSFIGGQAQETFSSPWATDIGSRHSAGGHLALITGMLPDGTGLDNRCYGDEKLKVAAIINWYGISDVNDSFALKVGCKLISLCLCVSVVDKFLSKSNHRDTEAQRRANPVTFEQSPKMAGTANSCRPIS